MNRRGFLKGLAALAGVSAAGPVAAQVTRSRDRLEVGPAPDIPDTVTQTASLVLKHDAFPSPVRLGEYIEIVHGNTRELCRVMEVEVTPRDIRVSIAHGVSP